MSNKQETYTYNTVNGMVSENMYDMLSKLSFSFQEWQELKAYADNKNIILFSTINSPSGIDYARKLELDAYKLSSWDFNYINLWEELAKDQKPFIIDTGPVEKEELSIVLNILDKYKTPYLLVHCFHTNSHSAMNMNSIPYLKQEYQTLAGFSSSDTSIECDLLAVALGASFLEKRLTLSRKSKGHHHILSLEPTEFINYVKMIRNAQKSLGAYNLIPSKEDLALRKKYFRSLVLAQNVQAGTKIEKNMLIEKRPGTGLSPINITKILGHKVNKSLSQNQQISLEDIEE